MLLLDRKPGQSIIIKCDDEIIKVTVIANIEDGELKLGFDAPRHVRIIREEIMNENHGNK